MEPKKNAGEDKGKLITTLFEPEKDRDLRVTYPELSKVQEFKALTGNELLFVWCHSSPCFRSMDITPRERMFHSFAAAFGEGNEALKQKYIAMKMPERVKIAMERMSRFEVSARTRSMMMVKKMFDNFEIITNINAESFKDSDGVPDAQKVSSYVNTCSKVSETLPKLIEQLESGFGVTEREESEVFRHTKAIDRHHESK